MPSVTRASMDYVVDYVMSPELYSCFQMKFLDGKTIEYKSNLNPDLIDNTAKYLIRYLLGGEGKEVFPVTRKSCFKLGKEQLRRWFDLISDGLSYFPVHTRKLDNELIWDFLNIAVFDDVFRKNATAKEINREIVKMERYKGSNYEEITELVNRSLKTFKDFGEPRKIGIYFKKETFSKNTIVTSGDADILFEDTLLNFYIDRIPTLDTVEIYKIVCYWLLLRIQDKMQGTDLSEKVKRLAIYNPRCNNLFICNTKDIPEKDIKTILKKIIGYEEELD